MFVAVFLALSADVRLPGASAHLPGFWRNAATNSVYAVFLRTLSAVSGGSSQTMSLDTVLLGWRETNVLDRSQPHQHTLLCFLTLDATGIGQRTDG